MQWRWQRHVSLRQWLPKTLNPKGADGPYPRAGGVAGALSRTATAPMDRLRMLQQVHRSTKRLTMRQVSGTVRERTP